jgi:trans-aconitate methyltransferase
MQRICEPELMDEPIQALAYAMADFGRSDRAFCDRVLRLLAERPPLAPDQPLRVVDLGCGPGNISFRLADALPTAALLGLDGAAAMLSLAEARQRLEPRRWPRLRFARATLPFGSGVGFAPWRSARWDAPAAAPPLEATPAGPPGPDRAAGERAIAATSSESALALKVPDLKGPADGIGAALLEAPAREAPAREAPASWAPAPEAPAPEAPARGDGERAADLHPRFHLLVSNSLLHHLHDPAVLWSSLRQLAAPGALVVVRDLRRPADGAALRALVARHGAGAPAVLRRDFAHSLRAAFRPEEVRQQLAAAGLERLEVRPWQDRYLDIWGTMP